MNQVSDEQLDCLVDGELSAEQQRTVLIALEAEPDGWRRCATAFLEAQAWGNALSETSSDKIQTASVAKATKSTEKQKAAKQKAGLKWSNWVTVAAAIMVAFVMGVASERGPRQIQLASPPTTPRDTPHAASSPVASSPNADDFVTLVMNGEDGQPQHIRVPIVDQDESQRWIEDSASADKREYLQQRIRETGQRVEARKRFWAPIETHDGQRFVVPIEQWRLRPMSHRQFQ